MAMRKYKHDRPGIIFARSPSDPGTRTQTQAACDSHAELHVIGLTNGYHGDTLGAMDAVAETPYNNDDQTPWYLLSLFSLLLLVNLTACPLLQAASKRNWLGQTCANFAPSWSNGQLQTHCKQHGRGSG